jgi:hypothetical protein
MNDIIVRQWEDAIKTGTDYLNQASRKGAKAFGDAMGQFFSWNVSAKLGKAMIDAAFEIKKTNETALNGVMRNMLESMNLTALANSLRELNSISNDGSGRLLKKYQDGVNIFWDSDAGILDGLAKAQNFQDVAGAMLQIFSEMNEKTKTNFIESLTVWGDIESAVKVWGTRTLAAEAADPGKSKS